MLKGCYYRCPIPIEEHDSEHPHFFVLGQLLEYNEIADAARIKLHDLLGSGRYYNDLFKYTVFRAPLITHCEAISGGVVECKGNRGTIITKSASSIDSEQPYWYWIKLSDGSICKACETELRIEYSQMNCSPVLQLKNYEFQHPSWFINHLKVSKNQHLVNNATYGFEVLAGCRAFLLPHQITTVTRCFETLPVRYMLADEVGLGKTVEACSILSILRHEKSDFKCLLIVPAALVSQWINELHYKYKIDASLNNSHSDVFVVPMEDLSVASDIKNGSWNMLIVDETHRLLKESFWYKEVKLLSQKTEHVLLLSATPIQDRNEEYHRLLTLLNPEFYGSMTSERFAWLVKKQKKIQQSVNQQLNRLDRYDEYFEIIIDKLKEISEALEDKALNKLINGIDTSADDKGEEQVKQTLAYICENYRMERKVVRNRRQLISAQMPRRTLTEITYAPLSVNENYNEIGAINNTLSYLSEFGEDSGEYVVNVAIPLLSSLFSSAWAFEDTLHTLNITDEVLLNSASTWRHQATEEHKQVNFILDEEPDEIKGRLMLTLDYIDQYLDIVNDNSKIVVFTAHNATLSAFLKLLQTRYSETEIYAVGFGAHMSRDKLEDSVYAFQNDPNCRIIVCDETGGEGRNFQNAAHIIHLDMPWNANNLEQRIGRLDRLGRDPESDVSSIVLCAEGTIEEQLFHIWRDGLGLFEHSLSGLEIITGELSALIVEALQDDYYNGLNNAFDDILDQAEEMRESVEDEKDFDIGATLYRPLSQGISHVLTLYSEDSDNIFATAMLGWGSQVGLHAEELGKTGLLEFKERSFSVNAAKQSLFIAPNWENYTFSSIMRREGKILGTFDRSVAALREDILFFAPGDSVYDSILSNASGCSRGRCTAIGTRGGFNYDGLIYIYNIEPLYDSLLDKGMGLQTLAQFRMYLPLNQIVISVPLTNYSRNIKETAVENLLFSLQHKDIEHLGRRSGGRFSLSPLEDFISQLPPSEWEPLVEKATNVAYDKALKKLRAESNFADAKAELQRILNGYRAECIYFERDTSIVEEKLQLFNATYKALVSAKPVLDAVCFLRVRKNG